MIDHWLGSQSSSALVSFRGHFSSDGTFPDQFHWLKKIHGTPTLRFKVVTQFFMKYRDRVKMGAPDGKNKRSNLVWDPKHRRKNISPMRCKGPAEIQVKRKIFDVDVQLVLLHWPLQRKGCETQDPFRHFESVLPSDELRLLCKQREAKGTPSEGKCPFLKRSIDNKTSI